MKNIDSNWKQLLIYYARQIGIILFVIILNTIFQRVFSDDLNLYIFYSALFSFFLISAIAKKLVFPGSGWTVLHTLDNWKFKGRRAIWLSVALIFIFVFIFAIRLESIKDNLDFKNFLKSFVIGFPLASLIRWMIIKTEESIKINVKYLE